MTLAQALADRRCTSHVERVLHDVFPSISDRQASELVREAGIPANSWVCDLTGNEMLRLLAVATRVA